MKQYRSRVDFPVVLVNLISVLFVDVAGISAASRAFVPEGGLIALALFLLAVTVPVAVFLFFFPVRYLLGHSELVARSGVLRWCIPLENIHRAVLVRSVVPSPALSYQRIRIDYSKGTSVKRIFLSPADRSAFLDDLAQADPGLVREHDGVLRRSGRILPLQDLAS